MSTSKKSTSDWLEVLACEGAVFILIVQPCKFPNDTLRIEHALVSTTGWKMVFCDCTLYICSMYDDCVGFEKTAETAELLHVCPFIASKCFSRPMTCTLLDQFFRHSTLTSVWHLLLSGCGSSFGPQYQQVHTFFMCLPTGTAVNHGLVGSVGVSSSGPT